jgi:uncharacterized FlaG/YvyC family protein
MGMSKEQKELLKEMSDEERSELLEALGVEKKSKKDDDGDLTKTVESLQEKVSALEKAFKFRAEKNSKSSGKSIWDLFFGGA